MLFVFLCLNRSPEFFYPNVFVKIRERGVPVTAATTSVSSVVFHGTHLEEVLNICQGSTAIFIGNLKPWRLLDYENYSKKYCSYYVQPGQRPIPMKPNNSSPFMTFGPFVWFGTKADETDKYGPCQFEFNFASVLKAYQMCRNSQDRICYRAAGTLVYKLEVCHIVMICCLNDKECQNYPLITANNTQYFKPPSYPSDTVPPNDLHFQTTINDYQSRHDHLTFALYIPNNRGLHLSRNDGKINLTPHNSYCVASRSKKCYFREDQLPISIDKLKVIARWISTEKLEEEKEPVSVLDQSIEESFEWLEDTEYNSDEGDQYDWHDDELSYDDFDAEQLYS